jgi:hypothetical protein
MIDLYEEAQIP